MTVELSSPQVETYRFADDGVVPNKPVAARCIAVLAEGALNARLPAGDVRPKRLARLAQRHLRASYYHSTAHEVLGIAAGNAQVWLAGREADCQLRAPAMVRIPAGSPGANRSPDLLVIALIRGRSPDIRRASGRA